MKESCFSVGGSFLRGGAPWGHRFDGEGGSKKVIGWGAPPMPPTMGNPACG